MTRSRKQRNMWLHKRGNWYLFIRPRNVIIYYLAHFIDASPIPPVNICLFEPNSCTDLIRCRTIWNIIWSCTLTIFSCTWVAVRPNIPCPKKREAKNCVEKWIWNPILSFTEHCHPLFVCALLVPKYVLAWAIRQYLKARKMASKSTREFYTSVAY